MQVGYLSSFQCGTEILSVINSKMALNLFRSGACAAHVFALRVFDKVLYIKVTITFITDVVYIFDILMFIPFCEEESTHPNASNVFLLVLHRV